MRINSLYISAFGGIKNLRLDLSEGLNVIYGDNENGKSTVMAFIKMMFYGSERGSTQLAKNIRKRYTPWDASQMAGSIDFELSGKAYRLEREFRSSNSTDKATLCDLSFGTRQAVTGDIGTKLLGLSAAAFERSVFIGQLGFPESDSAAEGELNSKLSNIALTGDESVSFEKVYSSLEKAKLSLMSKSGRAGIYDKNLKALKELEESLENANTLQQNLSRKQAEAATLENDILKLTNTARELKVKISAEQDIRNAEKMRELLRLKAELDCLNETLKLSDGSLIDEMFLRKLKFCISKLEAAEQKAEAKLSETKLLKSSIEAGLNPPEEATEQKALELENELTALKTEKEKTEGLILNSEAEIKALNQKLPEAEGAKKPFNLILLISGAVLAALGAILLGIYSYLGIAALLAGALGVALSFIVKPKNTKPLEDLRVALSKLETETDLLYRKKTGIIGDITLISARLEAIKTALNSSAAVIEKQQQLLKDCENELSELKNNVSEETIALLELYSRYKKAETVKEITDSLEEISQKAAEQKDLKAELNFILKDLNGISYEEARQKLEAMGEASTDNATDFEELKNRYEALLSSISDKRSLVSALKTEINSATTAAQNPVLIKAEIADLRAKTAAEKEFCDAAALAMEVLQESFGEVRRSYGSVLEKKAAEIFSKLTQGKYGGMTVSKSFDIGVEEEGVFGNREIGYLSSGAIDQAYLSLRLALSSLISGDGASLPILLDDALTQYDDTRRDLALEFLKEYSAEVQVIMFTCHKSISDKAAELGASLNKLMRN